MSKEMQAKVLEEDKIEFSDLYENALCSIGNAFARANRKPVSDILVLQGALFRKRKLGMQKYGESCFQARIENTLNTDADQHAYEEVLDLLNYLFHKVYVNSLNGRIEADEKLNEAISKALDCYIYLWTEISERS